MIPALPNLSNAVNAWAQPLTFYLVGKEQIDFKTEEVLYLKTARGFRVPLKPQALMLKPEGERAWKWESLHVDPTLILSVDDVVIFGQNRYRIMAKSDYSQYGYVEYEMIQDMQL